MNTCAAVVPRTSVPRALTDTDPRFTSTPRLREPRWGELLPQPGTRPFASNIGARSPTPPPDSHYQRAEHTASDLPLRQIVASVQDAGIAS